MRKVGKHRICRELITLDCGVASLTEFREIDLAPIHLADLYDKAVLDQYLDLQEERLYFDSLDAVYLKLVNKVVSEVENISYLPLVQGIVTIIIQRFFFRMAARLGKRAE